MRGLISFRCILNRVMKIGNMYGNRSKFQLQYCHQSNLNLRLQSNQSPRTILSVPRLINSRFSQRHVPRLLVTSYDLCGFFVNHYIEYSVYQYILYYSKGIKHPVAMYSSYEVRVREIFLNLKFFLPACTYTQTMISDTNWVLLRPIYTVRLIRTRQAYDRHTT